MTKGIVMFERRGSDASRWMPLAAACDALAFVPTVRVAIGPIAAVVVAGCLPHVVALVRRGLNIVQYCVCFCGIGR